MSHRKDCGESTEDRLEADFARGRGRLNAELSIFGMKTPMKVLVVYGESGLSE